MFGDRSTENFSHETYRDGSTYSYWKSTYKFNTKGLKNLIKTGYNNNPIGFSVINKIVLSQRELIFTPYRDGKEVENVSIDLDINQLLHYLITCGTAIVWKKTIPLVGKTQEAINPVFLTETVKRSIKTYEYEKDGMFINIPEDDLIFMKIADITCSNTNFGISPLQAALMPISSLNEMYLADASLLKNKGADVLISNGTDTPIMGVDSDSMDDEMNRRIAGARNHGKAVTSTAKLDVHQIGRTAKELAMWDGYKIKLRDICNVLSLDSSHFNDPENKKFANSNEAKKSLYTNSTIPYTRIITENKELVKELGYTIFIDDSNIDVLQEDQETRAKKNKIITDVIVGLNEDVQKGTITQDIAVSILVTEWNYDEEEARKYIS